jgi:hypothetical protein
MNQGLSEIPPPHTVARRSERREDPLLSWAAAQECINTLPPPVSFTAGIVRVLAATSHAGSGTIDPHLCQLIIRLMQSPRLFSTYAAAFTLFHSTLSAPFTEPNNDESSATVDAAQIAQFFSPTDHAAIISLTLAHACARRCGDLELFSNFSSTLQASSTVCGIIGQALPGVGLAHGLLVGSIPWLGLIPLLWSDREGVGEYLTVCGGVTPSDTHPLPLPDARYERSRWGYSCWQAGVLLLQRLGFGSAHLVPFLSATLPTTLERPASPHEQGYRAVQSWMLHLLGAARARDTSIAETHPLPEAHQAALKQVLHEKALHSWGAHEPSDPFWWLSATLRGVGEAEGTGSAKRKAAAVAFTQSGRSPGTPEEHVYEYLVGLYTQNGRVVPATREDLVMGVGLQRDEEHLHTYTDEQVGSALDNLCGADKKPALLRREGGNLVATELFGAAARN